MLCQSEIKPVYAMKPLECFLRSVQTAYESAFGQELSCRSAEELTLYSFPSTLFKPGTISCLAAPPRLMMPLFLKFLLDHADSNNEAASLLISKVRPEELVIRMAAYYSRIGINRLRRGQLGVADWAGLVRSSSRIYESNIFFAHGGEFGIREMIDNHPERAKPLELVLINDFFNALGEHSLCTEEMAEKLDELKTVATESNVAVVVSYSLKGPEKEGVLSTVKNHCDVFMTLHPAGGRYELLVQNMKHGESGNIPLILIPEIGVMEDR